ncbi:MAG: CDP-glucose 4,6-dehydratase [Deltaproteobacteria bacterium]|nr:CDP-glucose 4,6-dehydratase [Deltaproteobacteria bacterium]
MLFEKLSGKRVLLTGHTGFKGSWLSMWLNQLGCKVAGYSLLPETTPNLFTLANVQDMVSHHVAEIEDFDSLLKLFSEFQPEVVFHLAAQPLVRRSYRTPRETFFTNVGGTINVMEAIRQTSSVEAAVIVTTDKVYENREWLWGYRENEALGGHDPYSASKGACEIVVSSYIRSFFSSTSAGNPAVASVRAGNVIGGGDFSEDRIIPDAVRAVLNSEPLQVRSPDATRPWQHVLEPLGAYLLLACKLLEAPHFSGAWNIGPFGHDVATVKEIVEHFYESFGSGTLEYPSVDSQKGVHEARLLALCCDKARTELEWQPQYLSRDAISLTSTWYHDVLVKNKDAQKCCVQQISHYSGLLEQFYNGSNSTR